MSMSDSQALSNGALNGEESDLRDLVQSLADRVADLEAENERLREELDTQPDIEFRGGTDIKHLWVGGLPVGKMMFETKQRSYENMRRLDEGDTGTDDAGMSAEVRSKLLPAHKRYIDVREGDTPDGASERRAAVLFGQFVKYVTGQQSMVGVNAEYGNLKMTSTDAIRTLEDAGEMTQTGKSVVAGRAMKKLQELTHTVDCQCQTVHECRHALLSFDDSAKENKIAASEERVKEYFADVEAALTGDVTTADDSEDSDEDRGGDSNNNEVANSVVSNNDDALLAGDYETDLGDTTR